LTELPGSPFGHSEITEARLKFDPQGKFLYAAYLGNVGSFPGKIRIFSLDSASGRLTEAASSPFTGGVDIRDIAIVPSGRVMYGTDFATAHVPAMNVDPITGALTLMNSGPAAQQGNFTIAIDPRGKFLYVANADPSNSISALSIDPCTFALTPIPGSPFASVLNVFSVQVDPSGAFLYASSANAGIVGYVINPTTGALTPIPGSPFSTGPNGALGVAIIN
jgi:6-phosphogluconolactonase (cycloisomerase 2 family)